MFQISDEVKKKMVTEARRPGYDELCIVERSTFSILKEEEEEEEEGGWVCDLGA